MDGFAKPEDANAHVQVLDKLFPLGEDYLYNFLSHPNQTGLILQVVVRKTKSIVKAHDGIPYIRRGAQGLPVDTDAKLALLERNKGISSLRERTGLRRTGKNLQLHDRD
jgi:ATP-dependent DNA helicase RecG